MAEHALNRLVQRHAAAIEGVALLGLASDATVHARRLAKQHIERHVHRLVAEVAVADRQVRLGNSFADHREGAALAFADRLEAREVGGVHRQHVALLRLVAPDFQWAHARLVVGHVAQFEATTAAAVVDQLRQGVGDTAGTHVVDELDRVGVTQLPAAVDDLLATPLHFRVLALHRGEVEIGGTGAGGHRGGRTATQADQHGWAAEHDQLSTDADFALLHMVGADVAEATRQHDRLVVTTHFFTTRTAYRLLEGTEIAGQRRTAEFVVERGAAQRALDHDVQRGDDALGLAIGLLPGLQETRDVQVGYAEAGQAGLGLGATTGGTLVADLAAGAGGSPRERRDGGRVVVRLDLHQDVHRLDAGSVFAGRRVRVETPGGEALDHRGVVLVGGQHAFAVHLVGVLDHAEQGFLLGLTVDIPAGVEDLVPAVFGVGLGKHHQLDVVRVAAQLAEAFHQVVDFILSQGQAQRLVGLLKRDTPTAQDIHHGQRLGLCVTEQAGGLLQAA